MHLSESRPIPSHTDRHPLGNLISLRTAGALVGVDKKTVVNWINAGDLQGWRLNGHMWRVDRFELLALARQHVVSQSDGVA